VYVTDLNPTTIENLQYNVTLNFQDSKRVVATAIDWDDATTWPTERLDYVIGSDLIYQASIVPLLKKVILGLLKPDTGRFLYVAPDTERDGLPHFIETMKRDGCSLIESQKAPEPFYSNPLLDGDEDMCFLHFNELSSSTYILYEFCCS
jgi:tRNA G37 N-methylase Trm5